MKELSVEDQYEWLTYKIALDQEGELDAKEVHSILTRNGRTAADVLADGWELRQRMNAAERKRKAENDRIGVCKLATDYNLPDTLDVALARFNETAVSR